MLNIKEAMKLPSMEKTKLVAGEKGIHNKIKWVTIVEVLEDIERIQEGEFLITTGFNLLESQKNLEIFHNLLRYRPLSGVAIYTSFYLDKIPNSFIEIAEKNHLPLIEIPTDINFSEITKEILEKIVNRQTKLLEQSQKIHHELTALILNDHNLTKVTERLAQLTKSNIYIFDPFYDIIYSYKEILHEIKYSQTTFTINQNSINISDYLLQNSNKASSEHNIFKSHCFTISPIIAKSTCFGWIVMIKPKATWQKLDDIAIERATSIYAMEFLKKQAVEETQLRIQSDLLDDIFNKNYVNEPSILDKGLKLNYDFSLPQSVLHLTFKQEKNHNIHIVNKLCRITEQLLQQRNKQYMIQTKFDSINILTNVNGKTVTEQQQYTMALAEELLTIWNSYYSKIPITIGIGQTYNQIRDLGKSAQEAQNATLLSKLINKSQNIIHYNDLGVYNLLLTMSQSGINLSHIYNEYIGGLLNREGNEIDLIQTLDMYFKHNQSIKNTSEELYIHRHTLRYRLNQIEQLTDLNLKKSDDLLKLQLGVMAFNLIGVIGKT
ncbi:PucR family transcriptional regulator [Ornithinibacillus sp. 4-3]|uniref:PucR family transcriptional regulator n=1 Tax=Ornithinibacillus sp. 4-3 TaxID=3231488 RepID=A0AB39HIS4_9BACI